jgi:hypothetical protein
MSHDAVKLDHIGRLLGECQHTTYTSVICLHDEAVESFLELKLEFSFEC